MALLIAGFAGCAAQAPAVKLRIAGGEKIMVDLGRGGVIEGESKEVKVGVAGFMTNTQAKKGFYVFGLELKTMPALISMKVEDVTDDNVVLLVDDRSPKLAGRIWRWATPLQSPDEKTLRWIQEIDDSFRVYRFTIALSDGRQLVLHHAAFYPAFAKEHMKFELGLGPP